MIKKTLKGLLFFGISAYVPFSFSQEVQNKNVLVINNEASAETKTETKTEAQTGAVTAPALVPSSAKKLRDAREKQEIKTEDTIIKELEKQRLLDEQRRVDELFRNKPPEIPVNAQKTTEPALHSQWFFGNKSFVSLGVGAVVYPFVENINSLEFPAGFLSFGGYGYKGNLIFDLSLYYSQHYLCIPPSENYQGWISYEGPCVPHEDIRWKVMQPSLAMAIKLSPLSGRMKPYAGVSGSLVFRRMSLVQKTGEPLAEDPLIKQLTKDVGKKSWRLSCDAGVSVGADLALGDRLGLNMDLRYYINLSTEGQKDPYSVYDILAERPSLVFSVNLRHYF